MKTNKALKVVGIVVAVYLATVLVNVVVSRGELSNSSANEDGYEEPLPMEDGGSGVSGGRGGTDGTGGYTINSYWVWAGPLCWADTDFCW